MSPSATSCRSRLEATVSARPVRRTRYEYVLTERGRALFPLLVALMRWGRTIQGDAHGGVELAHADCGALLVPAVRCEAGHDVPIEETEARLASC
jgi:hypothetical protein